MLKVYVTVRIYIHLPVLYKFYIYIFGKKLTYEVTGQEVIYPDQVEKLAIVKGKDKATLLTCEPYTSSKYRLLIYGERVNDEVSQNNTENIIKLRQYQKQNFIKTIIFIFMGLLVIFFGLFGLLRKR